MQIEEGLLDTARAQSIVDFAANLSPLVSLRFERGGWSNAMAAPSIKVTASVPGAFGTFELAYPKNYRLSSGAISQAPFSSRAWGYNTSYQLARFNQAFLDGNIGAYLVWGESGSHAAGGELVQKAINDPPKRRFVDY